MKLKSLNKIQKNNYIVAIPFYKNEHFIHNIVDWFNSEKSILDKSLIYEVVIYNDCPTSPGSNVLEKACKEAGFTYNVNDINIGYLKTSNLAFKYALSNNKNLILLNSDTIPIAGFLNEIEECFKLDNMLGVLSARSNNATICNLYTKPDYFLDLQSLERYKQDSAKFSKYVPQICYVPVVTGFCFAVSLKVLQVFNGFDELYTPGYEEENDFCLRISERGYRIGIANRAFVLHLEGMSFNLTGQRDYIKHKNSDILNNNYKYYKLLLENYSNSLYYKLHQRVSEACSNSINFLIDARVLSPIHNGSNKFIAKFIVAFSNMGLRADVICSSTSLQFHGLFDLPNINHIEAPSKIYEMGFMLGQPMNESSLWLTPIHSILSTCIFFDTIAHDCPQLRTENITLDSIWTILPYIYSDISFISQHSKNQFELKFGNGSAFLHSHLLPIDSSEFINFDSKKKSNNVLIFGNKFSHKGIDLLLEELPLGLVNKYYVLGTPSKLNRHDVIFLTPGETSDDYLKKLMHDIDYFIFPSFAEGFGFPIIEALSYGKTIFCRDIACYREIRDVIPRQYRSLIKFTTNFSDIDFSSPCQDIDETPHNHHHTNYESYVSLIISDVSEKPPETIFNLLKGRFLYVKIPNENKSILHKIIIKIYSILLSSPFNPFVKLVKNFLFSQRVIDFRQVFRRFQK